MSYLNRVLQPGEQVVYMSRLHWLVYLRALLLLAIAVVVLLAASFANATVVKRDKWFCVLASKP